MLPSLDLWHDLTCGGGVFVAVGERGTFFTSTDGLVLSSVILPLKIGIASTGSGGRITLNWTGEGVLEEASVVTGPWTPVDPHSTANSY
jgi:hypothetical protein